MTEKTIGYTLHETAKVAVVATLESRNEKTGRMIQVWILPREVSPTEAVRTGQDSLICLDCKHRGDGQGAERSCYVIPFQGPLNIWKAYHRGRYPKLKPSQYAEVFKGRSVRFGAYGEPVLIPLKVLGRIARTADAWTGYTHAWAKPKYKKYRGFLMASVDNLQERFEARMDGWRTFRVHDGGSALPGEIACPSARGVLCIDCGLCNGARDGSLDIRRSIAIDVHGTGSKNFVRNIERATA